MQANHQQTLDDLEPVIERNQDERIVDPNQVQPRSRDALRIYDELQAAKLEDVDPLL